MNKTLKINISGCVRLIPGPSSITTLPALVAFIDEALDGALPQEFQLKWRDEDNDLISLTNEQDLQYLLSLHQEKTLRLSVIKIDGLRHRRGGALGILKKQATAEKPTVDLSSLKRGRNGKIYCGKEYTGYFQCKCGGCDGVCGPTNGCQCGSCEALEQTEAGRNIPTLVDHPAYCDHCSTSISGIRWKCINCADYDLCSKCEALPNRPSIHNENHLFVKLTKAVRPTGYPLVRVHHNQPEALPRDLVGRRMRVLAFNNRIARVIEEEARRAKEEATQAKEAAAKQAEAEAARQAEEAAARQAEEEAAKQAEEEAARQAEEEAAKQAEEEAARQAEEEAAKQAEEEEARQAEEEAASQAQANLYSEQAKHLSAMGFADEERNRYLLDLHQGDIQAVVASLLGDN